MADMNSPARSLTRHALCRTFALAPLLRLLRPSRLRAARLQWESQPDGRFAARRNYRADAQVVLLSVPVLRRSGVGGGSASWSENAGVRLLDFNGYSLPEHAAGLNRLGFIRELSRLGGDGIESLYFGLMTASPEESAAEARKALHSTAQSQLYSAIEGSIEGGDVATTIAHFTAPVRLSANQRDELLTMGRQALSTAPRKLPEFDPRTTSEQTFLQALANMLRNPSCAQTRYIYSGRLYRLWLQRSPDARATADSRQRGLVPQDAKVIRAAGKLRRESGGKETGFQLWFEEGASRPLPLRIEFQPRSYLRLMFETV